MECKECSGERGGEAGSVPHWAAMIVDAITHLKTHFNSDVHTHRAQLALDHGYGSEFDNLVADASRMAGVDHSANVFV